MIGEEVLKLHLTDWVARFDRIIKEATDNEPFSWWQSKAVIHDLAAFILKLDHTPSNILDRLMESEVAAPRFLMREMRLFEQEFRDLLEEYTYPEYEALSAHFLDESEILAIHVRKPEDTFDQYIERLRREGQHIPRDTDVLLREWRSITRV